VRFLALSNLQNLVTGFCYLQTFKQCFCYSCHYLHPGPDLGILRPWSQENLLPTPLICSYSVMCNVVTRKLGRAVVPTLFSVWISLKFLSRGQPFFPAYHTSISIFFNMPPLEICRPGPGPGPLWPVRKYGPVCTGGCVTAH
jgi:hypothetical protein